MKPTTSYRVIPGMSKQDGTAVPALDVRGLVRKSVLLNVAIILSGLATSACLGGPATFPIAVVLLAGVSLVVWAATFAFMSSMLLLRVLVSQGRRTPPQSLGHRDGGRGGVGDEWMDGPF